ncbi:MAG TPA: site-specific integrase [Candidatus Dormibacteraeota bacterium]|nr:site-specific integrase [Candidatus Dormibacteraeota bacterium]
MAQHGFVFRRYDSWFLKFRTKFLVNGVIVRKQKCVFLAKYDSNRFRCEGDVADLASEVMAGIRAAEKCPQSERPFIDYVEDVYLPFVQRTMKPSTYAGYRSYFERYIKPRTKKYALRDFTIATVSALLEDVAAMHTLNTDTVGKVRSILSGIFTYAMAKGNFPGKSASDNPASKAMIPEAATEPKETVAATRDEVKTILALLDADGLTLERAAVALIAYTGVRPGEARGLRWEEWNRTASQIKVTRSIWHAIEGTTKTEQSNRFVTVTDELRTILLGLWKWQGSPLGGYILARADGGRVNLDNMAKREIRPALWRCVVCKKAESASHEGHEFEKDETVPRWRGWYSVRRFHGTVVRQECGSSETGSKALGNSKEVFNKHYDKPTEVPSDVRKAVNGATRGLTDVQRLFTGSN